MNNFAIKVLTAPLGRTYLFSVGQAGYIMKSKNGQLLGIDMYLSECVERIEGHIGFKRLLPKILYPFELEFDVIIATHAHMDHFDIDSIPNIMVNNKTKLCASFGCKDLIKKLEFKEDNIYYMKPGNSINLGDFFIDFINCDHGESAPDAFGLIITVDGKKILNVGDTCLRIDRKDEYLSKGNIDVLIAPINGKYGNLNEEECAMLTELIKPKITVPSHYGMFASHEGNPGKFFNVMKEKYPNNNFLLMAQGEKYLIE